MSDRNVVATTIFVAGIMLGAFTVQLKDQLSLGIGGAMAAEEGTKTMPDTSLYPPPTPAPVFDDTTDNHWCYLPSEPCDNNHRDGKLRFDVDTTWAGSK
jgi:hypothetical protein